MGYSAVLSGGILDEFPKMRVAFLEAGCQWVHFMTERLEHRFKHSKGYLFNDSHRNHSQGETLTDGVSKTGESVLQH